MSCDVIKIRSLLLLSRFKEKLHCIYIRITCLRSYHAKQISFHGDMVCAKCRQINFNRLIVLLVAFGVATTATPHSFVRVCTVWCRTRQLPRISPPNYSDCILFGEKTKLEKCQPKPEMSTINEYVRQPKQETMPQSKQTARHGDGNSNRRLLYGCVERCAVVAAATTHTTKSQTKIHVNSSEDYYLFLSRSVHLHKLNFTAARTNELQRILC